MLSLLEEQPADVLRVAVVWIPMLPADTDAAAQSASAVFDGDGRVAQFHDPVRLAGRAFGAVLGGDDAVAWDAYLFFAAGTRWKGPAPPPAGWAHQLGTKSWADAARYHTGDRLLPELRRLMRAASR